MLGGIEAGGTKFVCAVGSGPTDLEAKTFPTGSPEETLEQVVRFFHAHPVHALGVGSFGPVDLDPGSPSHGTITSTPKPGWAGFPLKRRLAEALGVRVAIETDVNAAALGEHRWGAARGIEDFVYLTVGTGIGGGAMVRGKLLFGRSHPEMGHMRIPRDPALDPFPGSCPYHGDCLEGLASGPAVASRWGMAGEDLPEDHPGFARIAEYLALGLMNLTLVLSPRRIVMGGGLMRRQPLLTGVRQRLKELLRGYVEAPGIVAPGLGERSGVLGALALAEGITSTGRSEHPSGPGHAG